MIRLLLNLVLRTLSPLLLVAILAAQGVKLKDSAVVLYGSAANCSQPAVVDFHKIKKATAEWRTIKAEGVQRGTARYDLLVEDMNKRIKKLCAEVAKAAGKDCVICKGDVDNDNGLKVADLTDQVTTKLESDG